MTIPSDTVPPGRREARKQDRRQAIVAAARRSFLDDGYAATSMSGLLTTLGGSKATLWNYFRSKEELFAAVLQDVTAAFREQVTSELLAPGALGTTLAAFCRRFMNKTAHPDGLAAWRLVIAESARFPEVGQIFYQQAARHVETALSTYLAEHVATGELVDEAPIDMARVLIGLMAARHNRHLWGVEDVSAERIAADAERFVGYFLRLFAADRTGSG